MSQIQSRCGLLCSACSFHTSHEGGICAGCLHIDKPFWGDSCPVKSCCEAKEHTHCGECDGFACDTLTAFAYDKEQGDDGERIRRCRRWAQQAPPCQ